MFKSLSPDLSYVPDPAIQKKDNTTSTTSKPTQLSVKRPDGISKEALALSTENRLQYKVPKQSDDFAFEHAKNLGTNEARTRSAIQLTAKKDQAAKDKLANQ